MTILTNEKGVFFSLTLISNDIMDIEQKVLRALINFNFNLNDSENFKALASSYCMGIAHKDLHEDLMGGWREKLLASFCIAFNKKIEYLKLVENLLFDEISGKQIKGYVLAIVINASKIEALKILNLYLDLHKDASTELNWIYSGLEWLDENSSRGKGIENESKMKWLLEYLSNR